MLKTTAGDSVLLNLQRVQSQLGNLSQPMNDIGRTMETPVKRRWQ